MRTRRSPRNQDRLYRAIGRDLAAAAKRTAIKHTRYGGIWLERTDQRGAWHWVSTERIATAFMMGALSIGQHWRISHFHYPHPAA